MRNACIVIALVVAITELTGCALRVVVMLVVLGGVVRNTRLDD